MIHKPVLLKEVIENLNLKPGMTVVDGTLGAGGHSIEILKKILPDGKLISIDWDKRALENFQKKLKKDKIVGYWCGVSDNYANLDKIFRRLELDSADAIFVDLGFSSDQIEDARRGFSFLKNGPLDMRYSPETQKMTAADIVNGYPEQKLIEIFRNYGEERYAGRIAREIVKARKVEPRSRRCASLRGKKIIGTEELVEIISKAVPENYKRGKIHPATRVFQALRIEVNQELENLEIFLEKAVRILAGGGRLAVISFHSLEDRIVKQFFQKESRDCVCPPKFPKCICAHKKSLKIITKKPVQPSEKEIHENPRARSAKLRVAEKI